jgi:hypothetical protein
MNGQEMHVGTGYRGRDSMAKKKGFNLSDPATLIGFIVGLLGTFVFGIFTGIVVLIIVVVVYAIIDQKKIGNVLVGGLVGFLIGLLLVLLVGALFSLF